MQDEPIIVQKQATVGELLNDHMHGIGITAIGEKYGIDPSRVGQIIRDADAAGRFIPTTAEVPVDKVTDTPEREVPEPAVEPVVEGENPEGEMATTQNNV